MEETGTQSPTPPAPPTPPQAPPETPPETPQAAGPPPATAPPPPTYPPEPPYPLTFNVDYPDRPLNRLTSFFRFLWIIPIGIIVALLTSGNITVEGVNYSWSWAVGGFLFFPVLLLILFRKKYPRWWFDWNLQLTRFITRVGVYAQLLRDEYPSTDEQQAVHLDITYPNASEDLNRWLPLVKWFLAIPHYMVLFFLLIAAIVIVIVSWFVIMFTARYPRDFFDFVVNVLRWNLRVAAYAFLLTTDKYPPFRLSE